MVQVVGDIQQFDIGPGNKKCDRRNAVESSQRDADRGERHPRADCIHAKFAQGLDPFEAEVGEKEGRLHVQVSDPTAKHKPQYTHQHDCSKQDPESRQGRNRDLLGQVCFESLHLLPWRMHFAGSVAVVVCISDQNTQRRSHIGFEQDDELLNFCICQFDGDTVGNHCV